MKFVFFALKKKHPHFGRMTAKYLVGRTSEFMVVAGDVFLSYPRVTVKGLPSHCPNPLCLGAQKARVD